jgi:hypothetical protein
MQRLERPGLVQPAGEQPAGEQRTSLGPARSPVEAMTAGVIAGRC